MPERSKVGAVLSTIHGQGLNLTRKRRSNTIWMLLVHGRFRRKKHKIAVGVDNHFRSLTTGLFCSVLFCSILFYSILFYSILFYSILFYSILFYSKDQGLIRERKLGKRKCTGKMHKLQLLNVSY